MIADVMAAESNVRTCSRRWQSVLKSGYVLNVLVLGGGTLLAQFCTVVATPFLTRLYSPSQFAILSLYINALAVANIVAALRYETAIVAADDSKEAAYLAAISVCLSVIASVVAAGVLGFLKFWAVLGCGALPLLAVLITLPATVATSVFTTLRYWFIREEKFRPIAVTGIWQNASRVLIQLAAGGYHSTVGLLLGDLCGRHVGVFRLTRQAWPLISKWLFPFKRSALLATARKYKRWPLFVLPSSLIDTLALNLPIPLMMQFYGADAAGQFALAQRAIAIPAGFVSSSIADAFHARLGLYARTDAQKGVRLFYRTATFLLAIGIMPTLMLTFYGREVFHVVFGQRWNLAGTLACLLAPWALSQLVVMPVSRATLVWGGQELKLVYDCGSLVCCVCALAFGHAYGCSLLWTVRVLTWANVLAYVLYFALLTVIARRVLNKPCVALASEMPVASRMQ